MKQAARFDLKQIQRKIKAASELFEFAFRVKKFQLKQKHPDLSERELNHMVYALIEKGCK